MEFRNPRLVGLLTWAIVGVPSLMWEIERGSIASPRAITWVGCYLIFGAIFWRSSRPASGSTERAIAIVLQTAAWLTCVALSTAGFLAVLGVIVAAYIGTHSFRFSFAWIVMQSVLHALILFGQSESAVSIATAYFAFQLFALYTSRVAHGESEARQKLAEAHAELQATTGMLEINSRSEERLRIARDLHDLLGHHLTALSLNLEVARHVATDPAREYIERSQSITKLLLSDVRDVVSQLRDQEPLDLASAALAFSGVITSPQLHIDVPDTLSVRDPTVAHHALRALQEIVTNSVRHSSAGNLWLRIARNDDGLVIEGRDDGVGTDLVRYGHGLTGMRERAEEVGGTVELLSQRGEGFRIRVLLPLAVTA